MNDMTRILARASAMLCVLGSIFSAQPARAEEDCMNGPVPVPTQNRGQFSVPRGHAVRLTFTFNALWSNMVFVCDAITGHRILVKGNDSGRDHEDWMTPIDNTRSLAYYVVAFHKTVSADAGDAGSHPWISSPFKMGSRLDVEGTSGSYVIPYGFNDGGGDRWDNSLVTAYFVGEVGRRPQALSPQLLNRARSSFR